MTHTENQPVMDRLANLEEAAKRYRYSKSTLYKKIESGEWPYYRIGGKLYVDPVELDEILLTQGRRERIAG